MLANMEAVIGTPLFLGICSSMRGVVPQREMELWFIVFFTKTLTMGTPVMTESRLS